MQTAGYYPKSHQHYTNPRVFLSSAKKKKKNFHCSRKGGLAKTLCKQN